MARVFVAQERALGRQVVVKVLSSELAHALSAERFAREIMVLARLQHPNIVPVLTAGVAGDLPYYTMPFIDGESLRGRLRRSHGGERRRAAEGLGVLRDIARALAYAHDLGIVHRDVKPENVLLAYDAAVVADFGIAKAVAVARTQDGGAPTVTLTQTGTSLGTPAYMSPEQAAGDPNVDHRTDIYAWGIVAYEVLAGSHPFADRHTVQALITAQLIERPRPLDEIVPDLPREISELVMRCLGKDPGERPASARTILETLALAGSSERNRSGATDSLGARGPAPTPARRVLRLRTVATATGVALVLGGSGLAYVLRGSTVRSPSQGVEAASASRWTASPAYDAYLRGKVRVSNEENLEANTAGIAALREAIAKDPNFAPAYAELSRAYTVRGFYFAPDSEKRQLHEDAEIAAEKSLAIDPNLADGYFARGLLLWTPQRRFPHQQAAEAYRRAIQLDPRSDEAHHQLALVELHVGLLDQAQAQIDTALAINPANTLARFRLGVLALYRGQYEEAYAIFQTTPTERTPSLAAFQTATALFRLGREQEAAQLIDRFLGEFPNDEGGVGNSVRAMMLAKAGRRREAEAAIATAVRLGRNFGHFHHTAYNVASAYALLGDNTQAIRFLEEAVDTGFPCYPLFAQDTQLDALRKDPRFVALIARLERDWKQRQTSF